MLNKDNKENKTRELVMKLILILEQRYPWLAIFLEDLEIYVEMPECCGDSSFATDGEVLYVDSDLHDNFRRYVDHKKLLTMLLHEFFHMFLGHPLFVDTKRGKFYEQDCDDEIAKWTDYNLYYQTSQAHKIWYESESSGKDDQTSSAQGKKNNQGKKNMKREMLKGGVSGRQQRIEHWKKRRERVALFFPEETLGELFGLDSGTDRYGVSNEKPLSVPRYVDVFSRYVNVKEHSIITDEEIDYALYSYGFHLYHDMTFVEPPEVAEQPVVSVYIAIDVSGSCVEEKVGVFLSQTKAILNALTKGGRVKLDICFLLCDTTIQQEFVVEEIVDFPQSEDLIISGGGTDFRPVFERIKEDQIKGVQRKALFYFTDGSGQYPIESCDMDTYFVMTEEECRMNLTPLWIQAVAYDEVLS